MTTDPDPRPVAIWAAQGGQGATTVAVALAICWKTPLGAFDKDAAKWVAGTSLPVHSGQHGTVIDAGVAHERFVGGHRHGLVVRGPCSIAIQTALRRSLHGDFIILIHEPWRAVSRSDLGRRLGAPVVASIPFSERIPRLIDAGLFGLQVQTLPELAELRQWALHGEHARDRKD